LDHHPALLFFSQLTSLGAITPQGTTILIILVIVLLFISFCVSGAEVAFFSLTHKDINMLKTRQQLSYRRIVDMLEQPKILLGSLLIANSIANIGCIIILNIVLDNIFSFEHFQYPWLEFVIKVGAVSFLLLLFAEVLPKVLANQNNIRFAKDVGWIVEAVQYLFRSLSKRMVGYSDFIEKKLAKTPNGGYSLDELYHAIDITSGKENSDHEKNMLKGIANFSNITVKQIMKTRMEVSGLDYECDFVEVVSKIEDLHYSRIPVYKESLDEIEGILHTKDILPHLDQPQSFDWHTLIRPPYFVHENKFIEDLLKEFQSKRIHFAVVVDEFGGTSGIATLEDILEEVIGEIKDEFDDEDAGFRKLDDHNYIIEGRTMTNDVCKILNLPENTFDEVKGESDSLAGLVLEIAGEIPQTNQVITAGDFDFTVIEKEKNRLKKIKVTVKPLVNE
jgi:putative hemolysin